LSREQRRNDPRSPASPGGRGAAINSPWVTQCVRLDPGLFGHDQDMAMADPVRELPT